MGRLSKSARDQLKAEGKWVVNDTQSLSGVEAFVRGAEEANRIVVNPAAVAEAGHREFNFSLDPESLTLGFAEVLEDHQCDPFPEGFLNGDIRQKSGLVALSFILGMAHRVVNSSLAGIQMAVLPDVPIPESMLKYLSSSGEFSKDGIRFRYQSVAAEVFALVRASLQLTDGVSAADALRRSWLPTCVGDPRTDAILTTKAVKWMMVKGFDSVRYQDLSGYFFSGVIPEKARDFLDWIGHDEADPFLKLFTSYKDEKMFHRLFTSPLVVTTLEEMGLHWDHPSPEHLCLNRSLREIVDAAIKRLDWGYVKYRSPGIYDASSVFGPGRESQFVRYDRGFKDTKYYSVFPASVESAVESFTFKSSVALDPSLYGEGFTLGFEPLWFIRRGDVDWFDPVLI